MSERSTAALSPDGPDDAATAPDLSASLEQGVPPSPDTADAQTGAQDTPPAEAETPPDGQEPPAAEAEAADPTDAPAAKTPPPELHSGHKLAGRYRLEECLTRLDGFSSWRAVDEKLRRAVGIHVLPADHSRATPVLAAARSSALLGDPRFVQVLDAVAEGDFSYVVHEWLPDAVELDTLLAGGQPLEAHEAYQLVQQVSQAMAAAHREGLAHLCLAPSAVLRTSSGQYRIRGLAVQAALRGVRADKPQRTDTESIGALLYCSLTGRWPYEEDAYGLTGLPKGSGLPAPDQVRAGVHRGLSELAMRALVNNGATPTRLEPPCTTPEELAAALAEMPRIRPPEPSYTAHEAFHPTPYTRAAAGPQNGVRRSGPPTAPVPAPPALPGRAGKALKWAVSALLIAALALGSWQLADTLINRGGQSDDNAGNEQQSTVERPSGDDGGKPVTIRSADDFDPYGTGSESPSAVPLAIDGDDSTSWNTKGYRNYAKLGNLKPGVGLVIDLGKAQRVGSVHVTLVGDTAVSAMAAPSDAGAKPTDLSGFAQFDSGKGNDLTLEPKKPLITRYVLVWLTELPKTDDGQFRGRIAEISVKS
ncbi:protein kinase family protein [Streptomyces sp. NPDC051940]|uniref:protein kinase family protein n=1 Tax=Streptomyces sp. NPDC051940 TaxID=3155675 RepID=UPI003441F2AA